MDRPAYNKWLRSITSAKFKYLVTAQASCQIHIESRLRHCQHLNHQAIAMCCVQVYGKHRVSTNVKDRWLAHGLEVMLLQNKNLHVAFIDAMPQ